MAERDHGELGASREFLCLHFDRTVELLAKTGVEAEQLKEEELRDQVQCGLEAHKTIENQTFLLSCQVQVFGRRALGAACGLLWRSVGNVHCGRHDGLLLDLSYRQNAQVGLTKR